MVGILGMVSGSVGAQVTKNSRIRILGRLQTADTSIRVEAVRFGR